MINNNKKRSIKIHNIATPFKIEPKNTFKNKTKSGSETHHLSNIEFFRLTANIKALMKSKACK